MLPHDPSPAPATGAVEDLQDSAGRRWRVDPRQDPDRGRYLVFSPVQADLEPFRASVDRYRPDAYLQIDEGQWQLFLRLARTPGDEDLRSAAHRVLARLVVAAQHQSLLGAADDDE